MADISDVIKAIRDSDRASAQVFEKAANSGLYPNTRAGRDDYNVDLFMVALNPTPAGTPSHREIVPGQNYTARQLQLAQIYQSNFDSNQSASKGFKLGLAGIVTAGILALGSCFIDDEKPRHYAWSKRQIEEPVDAKDTFKGLATILGAGALIAAAFGYMKRK